MIATIVHTLRFNAPTVLGDLALSRDVGRAGAEKSCVIAERILHAASLLSVSAAPRALLLPGVAFSR
jgi:hypothetical protein